MVGDGFRSEAFELKCALARVSLAFWAFIGVLAQGGFFKVDAHDVGKRRQPRDDVGKFFLGGLPVRSFQFVAKFMDFINKPIERSLDAALAVPLKIKLLHHFLEFANLHLQSP